MTLKNAPPHIQLAVDLIQLLEENDIDAQVALDALTIVSNDYRQKLAAQHTQSNGNDSNNNKRD